MRCLRLRFRVLCRRLAAAIEKIAEALTVAVLQLSTLHRVISKKRDPISHVPFSSLFASKSDLTVDQRVAERNEASRDLETPQLAAPRSACHPARMTSPARWGANPLAWHPLVSRCDPWPALHPFLEYCKSRVLPLAY